MFPIQVREAHFIVIIAVGCLLLVTWFGKWLRRPGGPFAAFAPTSTMQMRDRKPP